MEQNVWSWLIFLNLQLNYYDSQVSPKSGSILKLFLFWFVLHSNGEHMAKRFRSPELWDLTRLQGMGHILL